MNKLPSFILVGSAKCGTSFLLKYLRQHPDIFLPRTNELYFHSGFKDYNGPFDKPYEKKITKTFDDYKKNFEKANDGQIIGEFATDYLYAYENSIESIKKFIGDPKILIILRNPIDRTFSHYKHMLSKFEEPLSFFNALNAEEERRKKGWRWVYQYSRISLYYEQVKAYLENFKNVKVIIYEDLRDNPKQTIDEIYEFLKVKKIHFENISEKVNVKKIQKNKHVAHIGSIISKIEKVLYKKSLLGEYIISKNETKMLLSILEKKTLYEDRFKTDIAKLESLLNRDLSIWRY